MSVPITQKFPVEMNDFDHGDCRDLLEGWGFDFGDPIPEESWFLGARYPDGWTCVQYGPDFFVKDKRDRERVRIGVGSGPGKPYAFISVFTRFGVSIDDVELENNLVVAKVTDGGEITGKVIYRSAPIRYNYSKGYTTERDRKMKDARKAAEAWLKAKYPDYKNVKAYWD